MGFLIFAYIAQFLRRMKKFQLFIQCIQLHYIFIFINYPMQFTNYHFSIEIPLNFSNYHFSIEIEVVARCATQYH